MLFFPLYFTFIAFVYLAVLAFYATIFLMWIFLFVLIFVVSFVFYGFDSHRAKKLSAPKTPPRPVSQMKFSDRS